MPKVTVYFEVGDAVDAVRRHDGDPEDLQLAIADSMQDPVGVNMAIILDAILEKGWCPDGYQQREGYRIYRYKRTPL